MGFRGRVVPAPAPATTVVPAVAASTAAPAARGTPARAHLGAHALAAAVAPVQITNRVALQRKGGYAAEREKARSWLRRLRGKRRGNWARGRSQVLKGHAGRDAAVAGREWQVYRIALVIQPHEAESRRLASHPGVVAHAIVAEEVAQVFTVAVGREVPDEDLQGMQGISSQGGKLPKQQQPLPPGKNRRVAYG